jgi:hypothetical protein
MMVELVRFTVNARQRRVDVNGPSVGVEPRFGCVAEVSARLFEGGIEDEAHSEEDLANMICVLGH